MVSAVRRTSGTVNRHTYESYADAGTIRRRRFPEHVSCTAFSTFARVSKLGSWLTRVGVQGVQLEQVGCS